MIYSVQPPKPPAANIAPANDVLSQALGDRQKLQTIKQKMNASYPPPEAPGRKVFSSRPREVDL